MDAVGLGVLSGQSHLNSDAKIAYEGRVYGGEGTHKGCPYGWMMGARIRGERVPTRGAPTIVRDRWNGWRLR